MTQKRVAGQSVNETIITFDEDNDFDTNPGSIIGTPTFKLVKDNSAKITRSGKVSSTTAYKLEFHLNEDDTDGLNGRHDLRVEYEYTGSSTTVSAVTSTTVFTLTDASDFKIGHAIYVNTTTNRGIISAISGNQITLSSALTSIAVVDQTVKIIHDSRFTQKDWCDYTQEPT